MILPRVLIGAASSGSGKTLITCALLSLLKEEYKPAAIKCGPDYIDPMFHRQVLGVPSKNLDTFFTGPKKTKSLLMRAGADADIVVMEGVMGLYDGLGGIKKEGSSYDLADVTDTPVILLIDAHGMGRSVLAVIKGFLDYDEKKLISGIILNRVSKDFFETLKAEIEKEFSIPVLGYLPNRKDFHWESRHLGLMMPDEIPDIKRGIDETAAILKETLDIKKLVEIAGSAGELTGKEEQLPMLEKPVKIGVAYDEAFCFYYEDNLALLRKMGAQIEYFSPLGDEKIPADCGGLILGGGYPELYAKRLSKNESILKSIKDAVKSNMPLIAECGGFLYLHESIKAMDGKDYKMAGVLDAKAENKGHLVRFGYVELKEKQAEFLKENERIKGHEFHYFDSSFNGTDVTATKPVSGRSWDCVIKNESSWMGFPHLYLESNPSFAFHFLEKAKNYLENKML